MATAFSPVTGSPILGGAFTISASRHMNSTEKLKKAVRSISILSDVTYRAILRAITVPMLFNMV